VKRYQAALKAANPSAAPGFVSLEGYAAGRLVVAALERIEGEPSRKALLEAVAKGGFDFGGMKLNYSATDNQGSDSVFLTVIQADGSLKPVTQLAPQSAAKP
jgi:branched-chain amino acid transport system substrate-binding protein